MAGRIGVVAPDGVPEVREGDDLAGLLLEALERDGHRLTDGDVVAVTSKVVSKTEGQLRTGTRETELPGETRRVVARRGETAIVRNRLGLTMAAAGIDASNVAAGHVLLLPRDPDRTARAIRAALRERTGRNVGVIVTDTAGRAWRDGQTDIAIGAAGVRVVEEFAGHEDAHGNPLVVTAPAVADEIAGMVELAQGKLGGRPFAVVSGRPDLVLPAGEDGPGASALIRDEERDLFGFGTREAVVRALAGDPADAAVFGSPVTAEELTDALVAAGLAATDGVRVLDEALVEADVEQRNAAGLAAVAFAHGWRRVDDMADDTTDDMADDMPDTTGTARLRPTTP